MKQLLYLLFILIILAACKKKQNGVAVLEKEKFAELLMEFSVAEASYSRLIEADSVAFRTLVSRNANVLKQHKVSKEEFLATYSWYNQHRKEFMEVYDLSLKMLEKKAERVRSTNDSLITAY